MTTKKTIPYQCALVALGVVCNVLFNIAMRFLPDLPLFMDSIFTVAVTFTGGLVPGLATGLLSNLMFAVVWKPEELVPGAQIYALCNMASALVVYLFIRKKTAPLTIFDILGLSILVALANSLIGGYISTFCFRGTDKFPSDFIVEGMLLQDIPILGAAILSRIPINLIDKTLAVSAGYGISLLANRENS